VAKGYILNCKKNLAARAGVYRKVSNDMERKWDVRPERRTRAIRIESGPLEEPLFVRNGREGNRDGWAGRGGVEGPSKKSLKKLRPEVGRSEKISPRTGEDNVG